MEEKQDFPMMIYHVSHDPKVIGNMQELSKHMEKGWLQRPASYDPTNKLKEQLKYYEGEIVDIKEQLKALEPKQKTPVHTEEEPKTIETPKPKKKPGRPAKKKINGG